MPSVATTFDGAVVVADGGGGVPSTAVYQGGIALRQDGAMYIATANTTTMTTAGTAAVNAAALQADMDLVGGVFVLTGTPWLSTVNASTTVTVTTATAHGGKTGDNVLIQGVTVGPYNNVPIAQLNGAHAITVVTPTTFTFVVTPAANATGNATPTGTITLIMGNRGGTVYIPAGMYNVAGDTLIYRPGVFVEGVLPKQTFSTNQPDLAFGLSGGTILNGAGTGTFITYVGADPGNTVFAQNAVANCGLRKLGIRNYANGSLTGGTTQQGVSWHYLEDLYFTDISGVAITTINGQHLIYNRIFGYLLTGSGMIIRDDIPLSGGTPYGSVGNSLLTDIYFAIPNFTGFGFSFEATSASDSGNLNEITANRLQANCFGSLRNSSLTQATSWADVTSSITVSANIENLPLDMPIMFSAAVGTVVNTTGVYFVVSSTGGSGAGTITVSSRLRGTAIVSNAGVTSTPNALSRGMSQMRMFGYKNAGSDKISNCIFEAIDLEGPATAALVLQDCTLMDINCTLMGSDTASLRNLVARNTNYCRVRSVNGTYRDLDGSSVGPNGIEFIGRIRGDDVGITGFARIPFGSYYDLPNSLANLRIGSSAGLAYGTALFPRQVGAAIAYPMQVRNGAITLTVGQSGIYIFITTSAITVTLPTITNASLAASFAGMFFRIVNLTGGNISITSGASLEPWNGPTAKTGIVTFLPNSTIDLTAMFTAAIGSNGTAYWLANNYQTGITGLPV